MANEQELLDYKVDSAIKAISEMSVTLQELTVAVTKLTLLEERQLTAAAALERAFKSIEKIDERIIKLEQYAPANKRVSVWLDRATWAGLGLLAMLLFKKSGLLN